MKVDFSEVFGITFTGLTVVFIALILLIIIMWTMGKIVSFIGKHKKPTSKNSKQNKIDAKKPQSHTKKDDSIIAAITAAISSYRGADHPFIIRAIKKTSSVENSAWKLAGLQQNTQVFEGGRR